MAMDKERDVMPEMSMRLLKAVAIVLAVLVVVPGVDVVSRFATVSKEAGSSGLALDVGSLLSAGDAYAALGKVDDAIAIGEVDVPEAFDEEIGFLESPRDIRVSDGGSVVGYVVDGDSEVVAGQLVERMQERGWTAVSLGAADGATFVKSDGVYRWTLVTCTQVGSGTSVVARCMAE